MSTVAAKVEMEAEAPVLVPTQVYQATVTPYIQEADQLLAMLAPFEISTDEQAQQIERVGIAAKAKWDELEARRKRIVDPINKAKDEIQDLFNPPLAAWKRVIGEAKKKIGLWILDKETKAKELQAKAEESLAEGASPETTRALVTASAETVTHVSGASSHKVWVADVNNAMDLIKAVAEGKAPANLVVVNDSDLQALAKATKGSMALPGVTFREAVVTSFSAKRAKGK